jgi:alpha-galactosidase
MRIFLFLLIACACCFSMKAQIAATPPMGWNSYNCYGSAVHEDEVKANAGYMAQHLKQYGWQYIVVDFLWSYDNPPGSNFLPHLAATVSNHWVITFIQKD